MDRRGMNQGMLQVRTHQKLTAYIKRNMIPSAGIILIVGLLLSVFAYALVRHWEKADIRSEFNRIAERRVGAIRKAIESNLLIVKSLGSFYDASQEVNRNEFREFVTPILLQNLAIQALEWIPRIRATERLAHVESARLDGFSDFQITERQSQGSMVAAADRKEYYPVYFVEPYKGNETALGFDLASDPTRKMALDRSCDLGEVTATSRITLVQETGRQYGFLVFLPIFEKKVGLDTVAARRKYLKGFVLGVFRIGDIVETALSDLTPAGIDIRLYDQSSPEGASHLFAHYSRKHPDQRRESEDSQVVEQSQLHYRQTFEVAGRKWLITCSETPDFMAAGRTWQPWGALLGLLLFTAMVEAYCVVNTRRSARLSEAYQELQNEIMEHRRSEEALRESEERFRNSFDNAPIGMALVDVNGGFIRVNHALCNMLGYTPAQLLSKTVSMITHPEDRDLESTYKADVEEGRSNGFQLTKRYIRSDQKILWGKLSASTVRDAEKKPIYYIGQLEDITDHRLAREEQERLKSQLQHAQKMEAVGTLAGGIAHDFNNLLQAILGYSQLLLLGSREEGPGYRELNQIVRAAEKGAELVRQLLIFGRKSEAQMQPLDLNHEIEQLRKLLARTIAKMIDIRLRLDGKLRVIQADQIQMEQVLMNLAVNARDAMPDGGTLVIATENVIIDKAYCKTNPEARPGEYVLLAISDTGAGMEPETLEHIFEPFYTTKETGRGTGLGLAIVYGIVKSHDGFITCRSSPGKGTVFEIYLPAIAEAAGARPEESAFEPVRGDATILLVEDEDDIQELGKKILEQFGYKVLLAANGIQALDTYRREQARVDLVILDLIMPEMDGVKCFRALRELNPDLNIIIASGFSPDPEIEEVLAGRSDGFIAKPYKIAQMMEAVQGVLKDSITPG